MGSGQGLLEAERDGRGEDGAPGHVGNLLMSARRSSDFTAKPGGVVTDEVGVITGEVTLVTAADGAGGGVQREQCTGADEWYTCAGAPPKSPQDGTDID